MCLTDEKCCGCIKLRTGAFIISILQIIVVVFLAALHLSTSIPDRDNDYVYKIPQIITLINGTTSGLCLLYGAIRFNATAILIHIILSVLEKVFMLVIGIVLFVDPSHTRDSRNSKKETTMLHELFWFLFIGMPILVIISLWVCLGLYFLVCMYRFYKQVKSGMIASSSIQQEKQAKQLFEK